MKPSPPHNALRFLRWFCREDYIEEIEGDLTEVFEIRYEQSPSKAKWKFIWSVIRYFRPEFIKSFKRKQTLNHAAMFRHNFLLTYRTFKRYKMSFFINLTGLSTGLACALLIYLWVHDELQVDKFHEKDSQLYQVMQNSYHPDGIETEDGSPALLAKALVAEMPEVEYAVTVNNRGIGSEGMLSNEDKHIKASGLYGSKDFFQIFSYHLIQGNKNQVLADKNAIVISERLAEKLFGTTENVMGKTLEGNQDLLKETYLISGVFENPPSHSTVQFDFIINYETVFDKVSWVNKWSGDGAITYITLKRGTDVDRFNEKMAAFIQSKPDRENTSLFVQPYSEKYLYGQYENGVPTAGRIIYVRLFSMVALFILAIACINFMNLSTAQASRKMKEIGVKKAIGADRKALIARFMLESLCMAFLSLTIAFLLVILLLPRFNEITGKTLSLALGTNLICTLLGATLLIGLASGSYPAFYLSGFNPIAVLKGKLSSSWGELWVRRGLVIIQFALSVIFIVSFLVIHQQIEFVQTKDLGYKRENVIYFQMRGRYDRETFLAALKNIPGVVNATNVQGGNSIVNMAGSGTGFSWEGQTPDQNIVCLRPHVGYDFIETLGIDLLAGRTFSRDYGDESSKLIINEAAAAMIGFDDIVGKTIKDGHQEKQIIGVVKNFHIKSLHENMRPCFMRFAPDGIDFMVKLSTRGEKEAIENIEEVYDQFHPEYPFAFTFIDDDYQVLYASENRVAILSKYLTGIAIIISCLGLFGLSAFTAERRLKEIGIRKILGATEFSIVRLLSGDFTRIVLIAIVMALPLSYFMAAKWLESFAYRIDLQWWFFIGAGLVALLIAWFTIGWQTVKAARVNPTQCLKDE